VFRYSKRYRRNSTNVACLLTASSPEVCSLLLIAALLHCALTRIDALTPRNYGLPPEQRYSHIGRQYFHAVNPQHTKPAYGLILRERRRYFRCPISIPVTILETKHAGSSLLGINISEGRMAVVRSAPRRRRRADSLHFTGSQRTILGRIKNLLVEIGPSRCSLCASFGGMQD
jgi:hypothetical protein